MGRPIIAGEVLTAQGVSLPPSPTRSVLRGWGGEVWGVRCEVWGVCLCDWHDVSPPVQRKREREGGSAPLHLLPPSLPPSLPRPGIAFSGRGGGGGTCSPSQLGLSLGSCSLPDSDWAHSPAGLNTENFISQGILLSQPQLLVVKCGSDSCHCVSVSAERGPQCIFMPQLSSSLPPSLPLLADPLRWWLHCSSTVSLQLSLQVWESPEWCQEQGAMGRAGRQEGLLQCQEWPGNTPLTSLLPL